MNDSVRILTLRPLASRRRKKTIGRAAVPVILAVSLAVLGVGAAPAAHAAPNESVKALDSDNAITDPAWFVKAYDEGFRLYVMATTTLGTCDPLERTQAQLRMALDAGLKIAVYTRDPNCWQVGITATGPYQDELQFFALDVEWGGAGVTQAMVDGVRSMGVRPVIYSGYAMWPAIVGESTEFSDVPLWDTNAGPVDYSQWSADYLTPAPVPYGGWNTTTTMRIGIQQSFGSLNGVNVDLNSFDASFLK
jgi:hypothetical protein